MELLKDALTKEKAGKKPTLDIYGYLQARMHMAEILWVYALLALFIKSVLLLGVTLDQMHTSIQFSNAWVIAKRNFPFYFGSVILPLSFAFLFKKKGRLWYTIIANIIISILFCADLWYFRGFNTMPAMSVLRETPNLNNLTDSVIGTMRPIDIVFVSDILPMLFIAVLYIKKRGGAYDYPGKRLLPFAVSLAASVCLLSFIPLKLYWAGEDVKNSIIYMYDSTVTSRNLSPLGYQLYSVYTFFNEGTTVKLSPEEKNEIRRWYAEKSADLPDNKYKGMFAGENLLMIEVESLEKFVVGRKVYGQEITPNLNRLLNNSIYFSNVHEQVHEGNTIDAEFIANTSLFPLKQGSTSFLYPYNTYVNTLPQIMRRNGYYTSDIQPDEGSFWNWMVLMNSLGFEKCIDSTEFEQDDAFGMGLSDESFLRQAEPIIVKQKQPFYTFMVTQSSHTPFNLPRWLRELRLPEELDDTYLGGYLQSIHYADKQLGIFLDRLENDGILKNTVVVVYGDHEGIHKYFPDSLEDVNLPGDWWKDNRKQTPLIIYKPGLNAEEIKTVGGEIDILPTVCYLMGIDGGEYKDTAMGRNLLNTGESFAVLQGGEYVGDGDDPARIEHGVKAPDIADMIIRGNYFAGK